MMTAKRIRIPRAGQMTIWHFTKMREAGYADFTQRGDPVHNQKRARCRICAIVMPAGVGFGYDEYRTDGYRFTRRHVCALCKALTKPASEGVLTPTGRVNAEPLRANAVQPAPEVGTPGQEDA